MVYFALPWLLRHSAAFQARPLRLQVQVGELRISLDDGLRNTTFACVIVAGALLVVLWRGKVHVNWGAQSLSQIFGTPNWVESHVTQPKRAIFVGINLAIPFVCNRLIWQG